MSEVVVVDQASRALLVRKAPASPVLPEGVVCEVLVLTDAEAAKLNQAAASFTVSVQGVVTVVPVVQPPAPLRDAVVSAAQSAVGVTLNNLTQAQRLALVACLLYRAGGLDPVTLAVRPLAEWMN